MASWRKLTLPVMADHLLLLEHPCLHLGFPRALVALAVVVLAEQLMELAGLALAEQLMVV